MSRRNLIPINMSSGLDMRSASPDPTTGRYSQNLAERAAINFPGPKKPSSSKPKIKGIPSADKFKSLKLPLSLPSPESPKKKRGPQPRRPKKLFCPPGCIPENRLAGKTIKNNKKKRHKKTKKFKRRNRSKKIIRGGELIESSMLLGVLGGKRKYTKKI